MRKISSSLSVALFQFSSAADGCLISRIISVSVIPTTGSNVACGIWRRTWGYAVGWPSPLLTNSTRIRQVVGICVEGGREGVVIKVYSFKFSPCLLWSNFLAHLTSLATCTDTYLRDFHRRRQLLLCNGYSSANTPGKMVTIHKSLVFIYEWHVSRSREMGIPTFIGNFVSRKTRLSIDFAK